MRVLLPILFFCLSANSLFTQNITQVVKGTIIDKQSEMPLIGATIEWTDGTTLKGASTDIDGRFRIEGIPIGRHAFKASYLGYETVTIPNVVVDAGKEVVLNLQLEESIAEIGEITVVAKAIKDKAQNELATISARTFSVEEVNRFSGGRSDVARLAGNFAGVSTADDSRNDIVIRGNSPSGVLWRLEGIPIPNPNHFSTLGSTGGPVSALNSNMLRNSDFMTSAFPAEYGNALAGVFDLGFRSGNQDKHEFMGQIGAISGLEAIAEGPLNKAKGSSYLIAGRYSFVGFASELGLDIGTNATPNYSDVAFKIDFGKSKAGKFTLFGIGGLSDIDFLHDEVDEDDLFAAPDEDAFAKSQFGVIGLKHNYLLDDKSYIRTVIAGSYSNNDFENFRLFDMDTPQEQSALYQNAKNGETRYSLSSFINRKYSARLTARAGLLVEVFDYDLLSENAEQGPDTNDDGINELITEYEFKNQTTIIQPYIQTQYKINESLTLNTGLHAQYLSLNHNFVLEPRVALNWQIAPKHRINLGYGLHHQNQPLPILLAEGRDANGKATLSNKELEFTRSNHFVLGYDYNFAQNWRAKMEVYYQGIDNVPVDPFTSSFSLLNIGDDFGFPVGKTDLVNEGTGYNTGIELTIEKFFSNGFYGLLTGSVYDSKYKGSDGIERNTAFNNGYVLNVLAGREFQLGTSNRFALTFDTKLTTAGGRYYTPVDLAASQVAGIEIPQYTQAYSERYEPYFRWDVKFGFKYNSKKRNISHQIYFDLQNVTNQENIFQRRYNRQTNSVNDVFQSGFFPDFQYRILF